MIFFLYSGMRFALLENLVNKMPLDVGGPDVIYAMPGGRPPRAECGQ